MQQPFAQHLAVGTDRFGARGLQAGQVLALAVRADGAVCASYIEEIAGHVFGTFERIQRPDKGYVPVRFVEWADLSRNLPARSGLAYKPVPLVPIV